MESREDQAQPQEGIKKVALVGFAESWKTAPFHDQSVEVWGLNELHKYVPRWDRWFEIHDDETLGVSKRDLSEGEMKRHLDWLSRDHGKGKPIYMLPQFCNGRFPNAVPLPLDALIKRFGRGRYYTSSIAYMLALAIMDGYKWIGMYGIDLASEEEYRHQRPCAEYYTGVADGMGITVEIAPTSAICKSGHLYGFEKPLAEAGGIAAAVKAHLAKLKTEHEKALATLNTLDGAQQECDNFLQLFEYKERGVTIGSY